MKTTTISKGFIAAGVSNLLGVPLFSMLFTNQVMFEADPEVMGPFGLVMIMVWGLAFIAVANRYAHLKWLIGVFALEKLSYVLANINWHSNHSVTALYEQDALTGIFYGIYGVHDFLFLLFFSYVFFKKTTTSFES